MYGFDFSCIKSLAMAEPLVDCVDPQQVATGTEQVGRRGGHGDVFRVRVKEWCHYAVIGAGRDSAINRYEKLHKEQGDMVELLVCGMEDCWCSF